MMDPVACIDDLGSSAEVRGRARVLSELAAGVRQDMARLNAVALGLPYEGPAATEMRTQVGDLTREARVVAARLDDLALLLAARARALP